MNDREEQLNLIAGIIKNKNDFVVVSHVRSDGDALASILAVSLLLDHYQKRYRLLVNEVPDARYSFLPNFEKLEVFEKIDRRDLNVEWAYILDTPCRERLDELSEIMPDYARRLVTDHHEFIEDMGMYKVVDKHASSTCELLYDLVEATEVPWTKDLAVCIYAGIVFDTGRFRFSNTGSKTFRIAARLREIGIEPDKMAAEIFYNRSLTSVRLLSRVLQTVTMKAGGKISFLHLDFDTFMEFGGNWEDIEGFTDYAVSIKGVEAAGFIKETERGNFKISLRSNNWVNVGETARNFNGGGHAKAAGCVMRGTYEEVEEALLKALMRQMKEQKKVAPG